jgi:hypothetical protein
MIDNECIKQTYKLLILFSVKGVLLNLILLTAVMALNIERLELPSSFNPVGSGARALGMGGAFISIADDATAASWNPGALIQIRRPEIAFVGTYFERREENDFSLTPELSGNETVTNSNLNYFSISVPCGAQVCGKNMVFSLNYQNLYNFDRQWDFAVNQSDEVFSQNIEVNYIQKGNLSPLGLAFAVQATETLSLGLTLNIWNNFNNNTQWQQKYNTYDMSVFNNSAVSSDVYRKEEYEFNGVNVNLGVFWHLYQSEEQKLTMGLVLKTPFTADIEHTTYSRETYVFSGGLPQTFENHAQSDEKLHLPMSYGIGLSYQFSDAFTLAADVYKTEWDEFYAKDGLGNKTSPISNLPYNVSDVDAGYQFHFGGEYRYISQQFGAGYIIPLRAGIFYDPAPAEGSSDNYYGFSLGTGIAYEKYVFDIAYQYRFADNVNGHIFTQEDFSQDVKEHTLYSSLSIRF